jgi:hypothetical protein
MKRLEMTGNISLFIEFIGAYRYKTGKIKIRGDHLKSEK